jgi:hypothetical protein
MSHLLLYFVCNRGKFLGKQLQYFLLATAAMNDINGLRDRRKSRPVSFSWSSQEFAPVADFHC